MDSAFDVPDSTDWLSTPLKDVASLENALHCQICKEFYDTPMITSCAHTFCSKCIRTSLSVDGKCPACRTADQASKLRNNWAMQEVVTTFLVARPAALDMARKAQEEVVRGNRPGKRKRHTIITTSDAEGVAQTGRSTRSKSRRLAASQTSEPEVAEVDDSEDEDVSEVEEPIPDDGLVECPLGCGKRMKIEAVDPHLDKCEDEKKRESRSKPRTPLNGFVGSHVGSSRANQPQDRISELNYSLLKESAMTKKLQELGIPSSGPKQLMILRHKEWVNLWNANCDSSHPRSKRELLSDLDVWERTQGGRAPMTNGMASAIMRKDFDGHGWARRNHDEFSRLIADAKRKKNIGAPAAAKDGNAVLSVGTPSNPWQLAGPGDASQFQPPSSPRPSETTIGERFAAVDEMAEAYKSAEITQSRGANLQTRQNQGVEPGAMDVHGSLNSEPIPPAENPSLFEQSTMSSRPVFTDSSRPRPPELKSSPVKRMHMFEVPQLPVADVDGAETTAQ